VLALPRDVEQLKKDIGEMRERMRESLDRAEADEFDIKQGSGGIADIEFMVQFGVLNWAHCHPALTEFTDNVRVLDGFATEALMPPEDAHQLADVYRLYRSEVHRLALQESRAVTTASQFVAERKNVQRIWRQLFD
jgi:glutamate-ammonia-ligase adenylyltransferase